MASHYEVLGVAQGASLSEIKRAFREKAKRLHPDIAGDQTSPEMRRLLDSYEVLSDRNRRFQYDKILRPRAARKPEFDYRAFLKEHGNNPEYKAKLIFFDLFNFEEEDAVTVWQAAGGLDFPLEKFLDREDWMDCGFILAEELARQDFPYEAFLLLTRLLAEERKKPYFRHFTEDVEIFIKEIVRSKLRRAVSDPVWINCMKILQGLGFTSKEEARWLKSMGELFYKSGDLCSAFDAFQKALEKDARITFPSRMFAECRAASAAEEQ